MFIINTFFNPAKIWLYCISLFRLNIAFNSEFLNITLFCQVDELLAGGGLQEGPGDGGSVRGKEGGRVRGPWGQA